MIPHAGRGIDTVNFRNVKESESVDISGAKIMTTTFTSNSNSNSATNGLAANGTGNGSGSGIAKHGLGTLGLGALPKGVPLDSGMATPLGEGDKLIPVVVDPFEEFNSVTLHHDGDDGGS